MSWKVSRHIIRTVELSAILLQRSLAQPALPAEASQAFFPFFADRSRMNPDFDC